MTERQRARLESEELKTLIQRIGHEVLPDSHRKFADAVGVEAALKLCEIVGGREMTIPVPLQTKSKYIEIFRTSAEALSVNDFPSSHKLYAEMLGVDAALKLFDAFGSEQVYVPKNDRLKGYLRRLDVHEAYYGEGMSVPEISMDFQMSERIVQRIISMRLDEIKA